MERERAEQNAGRAREAIKQKEQELAALEEARMNDVSAHRVGPDLGEVHSRLGCFQGVQASPERLSNTKGRSLLLCQPDHQSLTPQFSHPSLVRGTR